MDPISWHSYVLVFVAGLITALGTSLGAIPLFFIDDVSDRIGVSLWGLAAGLMSSASIFGLLYETTQRPSIELTGLGFLTGIGLVLVAHRIVEHVDYQPADMAEGDATTLMNIFIVLFIHSFPEGIAIGVSFAELNADAGIQWLGFSVPILAIVITIAIAIHNIPEGIATAIPMRDKMSNGQMAAAAFFTSVPQPIGAVIAFGFVVIAKQFLTFGYGLAAGAMLYLVIEDVLPEGLEAGADLPDGTAKRWLAGGTTLGFVTMAPIALFL